MTERRIPQLGTDASIPVHPADNTTPPDRSSSIDSRHTFARGGYDSPNSGPEHNPVLEVSVSLPGAGLHAEPVVRETQAE